MTTFNRNMMTPTKYKTQNSGSFDILDSSAPPDPVRVALYNSDENMIWSSNYGDTEGSFSRGGSGRMWLCIENGLTYERNLHSVPDPRMRVERTIGFSIRVKKPTVVVREMIKREVSAAAAVGGGGGRTTTSISETSTTP